jgi:hypothetical protein
MTDHILSAILTFGVLACGTAAIGTEMFNVRHAAAASRPAGTLPPVAVVAHRQMALEVVQLPAVTITGRRDATTRIAAETQASEPQRVQ